MKMGKRKDKMSNQSSKRRQILQLDDEQENRSATWQNINNNIVQRCEQDSAPMIEEESTTSDPPRINPLSGLLSQYMDCEDEESENDDDENSKNTKQKSQDKAIDVEVADFLKEIDALTTPEEKDKPKPKPDEKDVKNQWQECVDQTTGYVYYWNTITNQVSWEYPKDETKNTKINNKNQQPQPQPPKKLNLLPGFTNNYLSDDDDDDDEEEDEKQENEPKPKEIDKSTTSQIDTKLKPTPKMGPHLPTVENKTNSSSSNAEKNLPLPPLPETSTTTNPPLNDDVTDSTNSLKKIRKTKIQDLFLGPTVPQIFPPSLEDDSDDHNFVESPIPPIPCPPPPKPYGGNLFPTQEGVSKHRGFGFSHHGLTDSGKSSDKISFVKAETLDLNALNRIAANDWKGKEKNVIANDEDDDIDVIDRELDLALARKVEKERNSPILKEKIELKLNSDDSVEDEVVRIANDILNRLTSVDGVNKMQRLLVQTQTRLEDWRQGALTRSYFLTTLRQTEADVHRLVTQGDRIPGQNEPSSSTKKQSCSVVSSRTDSISTPPSISISSEPPPLPPAREFLPPPPPPDSPPPSDNTAMPMELEEPETQSDMQMELNSFYSDIGLMNEPIEPKPQVEVPVVVNQPVTVTTTIEAPSAPAASVHVVKKEKKLKKARIATGLVLKKKNMPYLVEKWQKIKWEESQINSSDDECEIATKRSYFDD